MKFIGLYILFFHMNVGFHVVLFESKCEGLLMYKILFSLFICSPFVVSSRTMTADVALDCMAMKTI